MKYLETTNNWRTPLKMIQTPWERGREEGARPGCDETSTEEWMTSHAVQKFLKKKKISSNKNTPHPFFHPCAESLISHSWSCPTFAFSKSRSLPMVVSRRQRHSRDSSSWFFSSFTTQSCMIASVSIFSLKSSPMNFIFPMDLRRALSLASSSSSWSRVFSSGCKTENQLSKTVFTENRTLQEIQFYIYSCKCPCLLFFF